jgi:predicted neuraminidase
MLASTATAVKDRDSPRARRVPTGLLSGLLLAAVLAAIFLPALLAGWRTEVPRRFQLPASPAAASGAPFYAERLIETAASRRSLHTPTLGELASGDLLAVWKVGESDEPGAGHVALHAATHARAAGTWGPVRQLTTSRRTQLELGRVVRTLANPVLLRGSDGGMSLFYVTAWAKWSTSSIALKTSADHGETWSPARRIVSNPVGNLATLVKGAPLRYTDGSIAVPAYHEFFGVFPQLLRLSPDGELLDKVRMDRGQAALQPSIVPLDESRAVAFMRNSDKGRVLVTRTADGGAHWEPTRAIDLPNPNTPVMGVRLSDGALLVIFNDSPTSRDNLSLALSRDEGERWTIFHTFERGVRLWNGSLVNFAYPYLLQATDGMLHVIYAWQLTHMKHVSFNEAWIRASVR